MDDIYKKAVDKWGDEAQIMSAIQEMAELIKELTDIRRNRTSDEKIASEIVDVEIMLKQLKYIFSKNNERFDEILDIQYKIKIEKINGYLNAN